MSNEGKRVKGEELMAFCVANAKPASHVEDRETDVYVDVRWPRLRLKIVHRASEVEKVFFSAKSFEGLCSETDLDQVARRKQHVYRAAETGAAAIMADFEKGSWEAGRDAKATGKRLSLDELEL